MSMPIDVNTIKMVFDNNQFEQNISTTISSITKLKNILNFSGAAKGLESLGTSVKGVSMDALYNSVYSVQNGFNALNVVATRVLQNITDMAFNTGKKLLNAITMAPITSGLEEYETQINSVQTILANTGDALKEQGLESEHDRIEKINGVLDDLNSYADMTIYNFTEMTRNIGTFTAAGVELDTAATSIKGIANLAAMSGSNSQQASTAMYQLSQAIAAGSVKLQDWNSVVNAGMGGKLFQNELIDTAKAMEVADSKFQQLAKGEITFRESLQSGWLSSEVLTNTLEKFTAGSEGYTKSQVKQMQQLWKARGYSDNQIKELTGSIKQLDDTQEKNLRTKWAEKGFSPEQIDHILSMGTAATEAATKVKTFSQLIDTVKEALQSGWTQSWEYIIGDFEQAKMLWTEISDILNVYIGKSADARNAVLKGWSEAAYSYTENGELIENASEKIVKSMDMKKLGGREAVIQGFRNSFQSLFEVMLQANKAYHKGFLGDTKNAMVSNIAITDKKLIKLSHNFLDFTTKMKKSLTDKEGNPSEFLKKIRSNFDNLAVSLRKGYNGITSIFSGFGPIIESAFKSFFNLGNFSSAIGMFDKMAGTVEKFGKSFKKQFGSGFKQDNKGGLVSFFTGLVDVFRELLSIKIDFITSAFDGIGKVFNHIIPDGETVSTILGNVGTKLTTFADALNNLTHDAEGVSIFQGIFSNLADDFNTFFDSLSNVMDFSGFEKFFNQLTKGFSSLDITGALENIGHIGLNVFEGLLSIIGPITSAFGNVFGPTLKGVTSYVIDLISRVKNLTDVFVLNEAEMEAVKTVFTGVFKIIKGLAMLVGNAFTAAWDGLASIFSELLPSSKDMVDFFTGLGNDLGKFGQTLIDMAKGKEDLKSLGDIIGIFSSKVVDLIKSVKDSSLLANFSDILSNMFNSLKTGLFGTSDISFLDGFVAKIKEFFHGIGDIFTNESGLDLSAILGAGGLIFGLTKVKDFFSDFSSSFKNFKNIGSIAKTINDFGETLGDTLESLQDRLNTDTLKTIARSLLEFSIALLVLSSIKPGPLAAALVAVKLLFDMVQEVLVAVKSFDSSSMGKLASAAMAIQTLGTSMLLFSIAIAILGSLKPESLAQGLIAVGIMLAALVAVARKFASFEGDLAKGAGSLIALAIALNLLVIPIKILGGMDIWSLVKGFAAVAGLLDALTAATNKMKNINARTGIALMAIAVGISILSGSVSKLGALSWKELVKGLGSVIILLRSLSMAVNSMPTEGVLKAGASILLMSFGIGILANAIEKIASIDADALGHSLLVVAASLSAFMIVAIATADAGAGAAGIALMAAAMLPLAVALKILSSIPLDGMGIALGGLAGSLVIFGIAVSKLAPLSGALLAVAGAMALFGIGVAAIGIGLSAVGVAVATNGMALIAFLQMLISLLPSLGVSLATMIANFASTLATTIASMLPAFVVLGKAILAALSALIPDILNLFKTLFLSIGQAILETAPQMADGFLALFDVILNLFKSLLLSIGQAILEVAPQMASGFLALLDVILNTLAASGGKILATVTRLLFMVVTAIRAQPSIILQTISYLIRAIGQTIISNIPVILSVIQACLSSLLTLITTVASQIFNTLLTLITTFIQQLTTFIPQIVAAGAQLITTFIQQLTTFIPQIVDAGLQLVIGFINAIATNIGGVVEAGVNLIVNFINGVSASIGLVINAAFNLIISFINGLATAIDANGAALMGAVQHLVSSLLGFIVSAAGMLIPGASALVSTVVSGIISFAGNMVSGASSLVGRLQSAITGFAGRMTSAASSLVTRLVSGITSLAGRLTSAASSLVSRFANALRSGAGQMFSIGSNFVHGIANGISGAIGGLAAAARNAAIQAVNAAKAALRIKSPSRVMMEVGSLFVAGFTRGVVIAAVEASKSAKQMAMMAVDAVDASIDTDHEFAITPVLDASKIQNGIHNIGQMLNTTNYAVGISGISSQKYLSDAMTTYASTNQKALNDLNSGLMELIDYDRLGASMANALIASGLYVKVDGQQMIGYLAEEIQGARRMYGYM